MSKELTRAEFYEKYGDIIVQFKDYYKYTFNFEGYTNEGNRVRVGYGGNSDEIYNYELSFDSKESLVSCCPYMGSVYDKDNKEIEYFYDY